jgi:monofunctional chorismate mutase
VAFVPTREQRPLQALRWCAQGVVTALHLSQESRSLESVDLSSTISLDNIRQSLIRQEDTIIFSIIERAQFARNAPVYEPGALEVPEFGADGRRLSLLEYLLRQTEQVHGKIRRYTSPEEQAFYPEALPALVLPPIKYPEASCAQMTPAIYLPRSICAVAVARIASTLWCSCGNAQLPTARVHK